MTLASNDAIGAYRIGAVARLTGISPDTLRIWERRYDIVEPERTPKGGRLYSQQDVTRLTMIKTLVDSGHAISTVANLPLEELNRRLNNAQPANLPPMGSGQHEVCVVGQAISVRACNTDSLPDGLEMAGAYTDLEAFLDRVRYPLAVRSSGLLEDSWAEKTPAWTTLIACSTVGHMSHTGPVTTWMLRSAAPPKSSSGIAAASRRVASSSERRTRMDGETYGFGSGR